MKKFSVFYQENTLNESLDTPVEFNLTDDTQLPFRIHGVFELDGDTYGMSLELSDHEYIYILSFYRILAKQKRMWSFKKRSQIRTCLSTLIRFAESAITFVKPKLKGIIVKIPGENAERYILFAKRLIKKSYIKSFRVLPVAKNPDKKIYPWENLFISKIGISPASVFSGTKFKNYDFNREDGITSEISAEIKPLKKSKIIVSTEPSKKYMIKNLEVSDITIDDDIFDKITKVEVSSFQDEKIKSEYEDDKELSDDDVRIIGSFTKSKRKRIAQLLKYINEDKLRYLANAISFYMPHFTKSVANNEFDKHQDFMQKLTTTYEIENIPEALMKILQIKGIIKEPNVFSEEDSFAQPPKNIFILIEKIKNFYNHGKGIRSKTRFEYSSKDEIVYDSRYVFDLLKPSDIMKKNYYSKKVYKTNVDVESLISTVPVNAEIDYSEDVNVLWGGQQKSKFDNSYENFNTKPLVDYLMETLGYGDEVKQLKNFKDVYDYTSNSYSHLNNTLRKSFNWKMNDENYKIQKNDDDFAKVKRLNNCFKEISPLKDSLWVYRSTNLPFSIMEEIKQGSDFMDPGFLSTSLRPEISFGDEQKFRIFIPKNARVIPVLKNSDFSHEDEIILPPMSVIKIIRIDELDKYKIYITGIFVGSAFDNFYSSLKESHFSDRGYFILENNKKKDGYDPAEKFKGTTDEKTLKNALEFLKKSVKDTRSLKLFK